MDYGLGKMPHRSARALVRPFLDMWPKLAESVFLADGAIIIGQAELGENVNVWFNAVIRADVHFITIGDNTNIQDNAVIHCTTHTAPTQVGKNCTIGHLALLHGCTVEDDCLIGMHATVMDGAVIGKGSIVGAGAVVTQGTIIPPYSLVLGMPAKVVKTLTPENADSLRSHALNYVELAKRYTFND